MPPDTPEDNPEIPPSPESSYSTNKHVVSLANAPLPPAQPCTSPRGHVHTGRSNTVTRADTSGPSEPIVGNFNQDTIAAGLPHTSAHLSVPTVDVASPQQVQTSIARAEIRPHQSAGASTMSTSDGPASLPANDGMQLLRQQMHRIRDMALSAEEKAQKMHNLMVADYERLKMRQKSSQKDIMDTRSRRGIHTVQHHSRNTSTSSVRSASTIEAFRPLEPHELEPTYYPQDKETELHRELDDSDSDGDSRPLGCPHYMRNIKVQCPQCERFYTCRHCHDESEDHILVRKEIRNILCMLCGHPQRATEYCRQCEEPTACYYCKVCKLWDNDPTKTIYHCPDCGICRKGEGLGKDYIHCIRCNVCVNIQHAQDHRCVERATDCDCPICGEYMFSSSSAVVAMRCGHYIHRTCYDELMKKTYKCPMCSRSAVNMELQWRKMDECLDSQPMPEEYRDTRAWISCNDCHMRSCVPFHWLGNKCRSCDSYNTNQVSLVDEPIDNTFVTSGIEAQQHEIAHAAGLPHPSGAALAGNTSLAQSAPLDTSETLQSPQAALGDLAQSVDDDNGGDVAPQSARALPYRHLQEAFPAPPSPLDPDQYRSAVRLRHHTDSSASVPASIHSETDDEMGFWGEGINPSDYMPSMPSMPNMSIPQMPNMPRLPRMPSVSVPSMPSGWRSPRLFAATVEDEVDPPLEGHIENDHRGWGFDPRQWRLGSPTDFFRSQTSPDEHVLSDDEAALGTLDSNKPEPSSASRIAWDPRLWRFPGSPKSFNDPGDHGGHTTSGVTTGPEPASGWGIDPRSWRIANQGLFARSRSVDTAALHSSSVVQDEPSTSPSSIWSLQPHNFLTRRFGSFSVPGTSDTLGSDDEEGGEEGEQDDNSQEDSDDDEEAELSPSEKDDGEEGDEDELDLIGHR